MEEPVTIPGKPYIESELVEYIEQHDRCVTVHQQQPKHVYGVDDLLKFKAGNYLWPWSV